MEKIVEKSENNQESKVNLEENVVITDAQPLSWGLPEGYVHKRDQYPILMPSTVDGEVYGLPKGWKVVKRPRTNPKYFGKYDQVYYEPVTNNQFRSLKQVQNRLKEIDAKQSGDQQQPQQGPEKDHHQVPDQRHGKKPVILQDQSEAVQNEPGTKKKAGGNSSNERSRKKKKAACVEFDFSKPPKEVTWTLTDAENNQWKPTVGEKRVPEAVKDSWAETLDKIYHKNNIPRL